MKSRIGPATGCLAWLLGAVVGASPAGAAPERPPAAPVAIDFALDAPTIAAHCRRDIGLALRGAGRRGAGPPARRTFASVVRPLEDLQANLNDRLVAESFLSSVAPARRVRDASLACQNAQSDFLTALTARPDLYRAVAAAAASRTARTRAERKLLELWLVALKRSGAGLPAATRKRFVAQSQRLTQLQNAFGANLGNDRTTIRLSSRAVAGLPAELVASFKVVDGAYVVPVNESTSEPFMQNATDPQARKRYFLASATLVPQNVVLLRRAIALRAQLAHLLGYPTWGAYVLADRMASSPAHVTTFLRRLDAKVLPRARADIARLARLKAKDRRVTQATIEPWDIAFYDNELRKTQYAVDSNVVKSYFPVRHVERAVFDIYSKLLGITFAQRIPANAWAPGVTQWSVTDTASGRYIGDFYLDLFPRDGKFSHFASFPLLPNRRLADGRLRPPLDAIVGNWPAPVPGKPALLTHGDVETFFHEFGHDMATLLATTPFETLSSGFRQDFVEAPSQMLENWVWDPHILKKLSRNVATGAPLPDATIARMRAARYVDNAYYTTRQIMLASVDMAYHTAGPAVDTTAVWAQESRALTPVPLAAGIHPESSFGHLMGGYDAGYYGYLWSKVYAQDLFTAFAGGGLESAAVGERYRRDILEPAREREPDDEVRAFLGRAMDPAAFYREFDASASSASSASERR
ncbi:MAG: M3 family metallopeptidase [Vulcanimicrobiaceae bacterium]